MLKRSAEADLDAFLESDEKKCLVIRGARQVGKTYLVREAGRKRTGFFGDASVRAVCTRKDASASG